VNYGKSTLPESKWQTLSTFAKQSSHLNTQCHNSRHDLSCFGRKATIEDSASQGEGPLNYLVSGLPRCRTAWLTALFNAHGSLCYHDVIPQQLPYDIQAGICDPSLACVTPEKALAAAHGKPKVYLFRPLEESIAALEKWWGQGKLRGAKDLFSKNAEIYRLGMEGPKLHVDQLDDNHVVADLVKYCTGKDASKEIIEIFQLLKIEEHRDKSLILMNNSSFDLSALQAETASRMERT
jgi:hypothetical protein